MIPIKMPIYHICVSLVAFVGLSHAVPHPYCVAPLNRTDCGMKTTPVFSYYKPGSRCEIEYWRGCPTWNKFDSEYSCSSLCIFTIGGEADVYKVQHQAHNEIKPVVSGSSENNSISHPDGDIELTCEGELDENDCGAEAETVYSFDSQTNTCTQKTWYGCKIGAGNKFPDEATCITYCVTVDIRDWEVGIEKLEEEDINKMQNIIDELLLPHAVDTKESIPESTESPPQATESIPESTELTPESTEPSGTTPPTAALETMPAPTITDIEDDLEVSGNK